MVLGFPLEMLNPCFPIPLAPARTEAVEGRATGGKKAQAVMGGNGRHQVFQESPQLPRFVLQACCSLVFRLWGVRQDRDKLSLFSVADSAPPQTKL